MDGWTKNLLKCTTSHSSGDIGEIVIFSQRTVYGKGMGVNIWGIDTKDTFGGSNLVKSKNSLVYFWCSKGFC